MVVVSLLGLKAKHQDSSPVTISLEEVRITVSHLNQIWTSSNLVLHLFCSQCKWYRVRANSPFFQIFSDNLLYSILADLKLICYHSKWQVTVLQQQLPNLFDVAFPSSIRGAATPEVVLNIFLPHVIPSRSAKNVGSH
jgi:hypothetical protein